MRNEKGNILDLNQLIDLNTKCIKLIGNKQFYQGSDFSIENGPNPETPFVLNYKTPCNQWSKYTWHKGVLLETVYNAVMSEGKKPDTRPYSKYYQKKATKKQLELLSELKRVLGNELDFGFVGKKKRYSAKEASKLISLNKDIGFGIIEGGQCTIPQYETLTLLAGRKPKLERYLIGHGQAAEWIKKYSNKKGAV